jgi:hypothetical protein
MLSTPLPENRIERKLGLIRRMLLVNKNSVRVILPFSMVRGVKSFTLLDSNHLNIGLKNAQNAHSLWGTFFCLIRRILILPFSMVRGTLFKLGSQKELSIIIDAVARGNGLII